jgi:alpha-beta hydrolase superfamily lysophospholipase
MGATGRRKPVMIAGWDEPTGGTPRGTLVVLPGRGETSASYARFGRRLAADAWRVRLVPVDLRDLTDTEKRLAKVLADDALPTPIVLVGADTGATLAALLAPNLPVDATIIAGLALPHDGQPRWNSWEEQVDARTACPLHRRVIRDDVDFNREALDQPLPWTSVRVIASGKPALVLHGTDDIVTPVDEMLAVYGGREKTVVQLVEGGRHDVLNDASHRSVAAAIVLFLESLRLGTHLPAVIHPPPGVAAP